ncbi:hypothetical protein B0H14DRAFT_3148483 [Mycena olivaceomarginata]|nr:hypothetical protein B0H14DRAFT_3148483 [Mycena olivaceomarginata]
MPMRGRRQIEGRKSMEGPVHDAQKGLIARVVSDCGSTTTRRLQKLGTRFLGRDSAVVVLQCVRPGQLDTIHGCGGRKSAEWQCRRIKVIKSRLPSCNLLAIVANDLPTVHQLPIFFASYLKLWIPPVIDDFPWAAINLEQCSTECHNINSFLRSLTTLSSHEASVFPVPLSMNLPSFRPWHPFPPSHASCARPACALTVVVPRPAGGAVRRAPHGAGGLGCGEGCRDVVWPGRGGRGVENACSGIRSKRARRLRRHRWYALPDRSIRSVTSAASVTSPK